MAEHLIIKGETKAELYATLLPQLQSLIEGESDIIANMANISIKFITFAEIEYLNRR